MSIRRTTQALVLVSLGVTGAGCSAAAGSSGAADPEFQSAAEELSIGNNSVAPGEEAATTSSTITLSSIGTTPVCHPHLFERSIDYARALNYHVFLFVRDIDLLVLLHPHLKTGTEHQWLYTSPEGESVDLTIDKTAPGVFSLQLSIAPKGSTTYVPVASGSVDRSNPDDVKKSLSFDFDSLRQVLPPSTVDQAAGQLTVDFERVSQNGADRKRMVTYTLSKFVPVYGDPHGPRSGNIYFLGEPGVGGAMIYDSSTVFFCPANPQQLSADTITYARWYVSGGTVAGRADSRATGGQFPTGDSWAGVACRSVSAKAAAGDDGGTSTVTDNGYWMVKEEDASGATVRGTDVSDTTPGDPACDPAFGPVTDLADATNDPILPTTIPASGAFPGQY
jgi:hypothetical protein